ncbi:MAG: BamA/TamA family outer membrane protein [Candidatus Cloacimonetes bacterium]|nr:BamA/TamA family outer membrane protein [Candidatus Cloacimonadota bacterium]
MKKTLVLCCLLISLSLAAQYYGKNKIQAEKTDWNKMQTLHFDIYYPCHDDDFGRIVALCAEEAYYYLREDFRTPVKQRIPIIFYSSHEDFEATNVIPNLLSEGVGGFTESMHNRVVMPFSGSYREMEKTLTHELTHAYVNELTAARSSRMASRSLPFWLSEGLPEFISVNGKSLYNNMFIMDLVYNNKLINLEEVGGYYAYREGEAFLKYIEDEYGRDKVMEIFYSARVSSQNDFSKKIFDCSFTELQLRWENYLKRKYFAIYNDFQVPYEACEKRTFSEKDGSSMNTAPRWSPDGIHYTWFSNKQITDGIYLADRLDLKKPVSLIRSGVNGKVEEFHFKKNNIAWFPDSTTIAFSANTSFGDRIYCLDTETRKITKTISFDDIKVIYELDISPDGSQIVFSGIKDTDTDIFIYDLNTSSRQRLTSDRYYDAAPRWSPDGSKIAFYSERLSPDAPDREHVFDNCVQNIYYYDLALQKFFQVTNSSSDCYNPEWNSDSSRILYISHEDQVANIKAIDIITASQAQITSVISGVLNFDLSPDDDNLIFSCFHQGAWDIYLAAAPLDSLIWQNCQSPQPVEFIDDFWEIFNIDRIHNFGKTNLAFKKPGRKNDIDPKLAELYDIDIDYGPDTTIVEYNRQVDKKPNLPNEPEIAPYKTKMKIDYFWGGLAYSSSGTYAMLDVWASDILGNHSLYSSLNVSGSIENSSILLQYLNLEHRNDYGGGVFYLNDETIYRIEYSDFSTDDYFRKRIRQYGFFTAFIHPFDKYWRTELQISFLRQQTFRDWWNDSNDEWMEEYLPDFLDLKTKEEAWLVTPQLSFVHDNTLYGSVGPVSGWKGFLNLKHGFSTNDSYNFAYTDLRKYFFFAKRYSWANRLLAGWINGDTTSEFDLTGFYGVRGFDDADLTGKNKILLSTEFRFPLIDNLSLAFPLPIRMYGVRGSAFVDIGSVWNEGDKINFSRNGSLDDPKMGFGFGPRLNMGFFVLKFDIAWATNLTDTTKPKYYLWLIEDF